jgi:hypothetical protein
MARKLTLELEALAVDSFATSAAPGEARGTVRGREDQAAPDYFDCTCAATCVCATAYYWCGDGYQTLYSCTYTQNESCAYTKGCPPTA